MNHSCRRFRGAAVPYLPVALLLFLGCATPSASQPATAPERVEVVPPLGHSADGITAAEISANGAVVASSGEDFSIRLWDVKTGRFLRTLFVDAAAKRAPRIALSSDGTVLLAALYFGQKVFDTRTGKVMLDFPDKDITDYVVALSADGKTVASASAIEKTIKVSDTAQGKEIWSLRGHGAKVTALAFSPDGKRIASGSTDAPVRLWSAETGKPLKVIEKHDGEVVSLSYSPLGSRLLVRGASDAVLLDAESGQDLAHISNVDGADFDFSPDDAWLISNSNGAVRLWNTRSGEASTICPDGMKDYRLIGFAADSAQVLFEKDAAIVSVSTKTCEIAAFKIDHAEIGISADRRRLLVANGPAVELTELATATVVQTFAPKTEGVSSNWLSLDGTMQLWTGADGLVHARDIQTRRNLGSCEQKVADFGSPALSPDHRQLILSHDDNAISFCDLATSKVAAPLYSHKDTVHAIAMSPSGGLLASGDEQGTVKIWDFKAKRLLQTLTGRARSISTLNFSADEKRLFAGTNDNRIHIWDVANWRELQVLRMMSGPVAAVDLSQDGKSVAAGSSALEIRLWDAQSGKQIRKLNTDYPGDRMSTTGAVVYSPANKRLMASSYGNKILVWDVEAGRALRTFAGTGAAIAGLAFAPDKSRLLSVDEAGILKYWDPNTGTLLAQVFTFPDGGWLVITPEGFFDASSAKAGRSLNLVRGLDVTAIDRAYDQLFQPSVVQEKLAGDPNGKVKAAAARLNLAVAFEGGAAH
jgi:WD40 repeat protein